MKKWAREVTLHKVSIHGAHKKKDKCSQDTPPPHTPRNLGRDPSAGGQWAAHAVGHGGPRGITQRWKPGTWGPRTAEDCRSRV